MTILSKEELLDSMIYEISILKHLHSKITPEMENFKFSDKQRTTLELLRYLAHVGSSSMDMIDKASDESWDTLSKRTENMPLADFPKEMDREIAEIKEKFSTWTDDQLDEPIGLWGTTIPRRHWLVNLTFKSYVAYKMQLFLQLKSSGRGELNTMNLWRGADSQMPN